MWSRITNYIKPDHTKNLRIYDHDNDEPVLFIDKSVSPESDRDGAVHTRLTRTGGKPQNGVMHEYHIDCDFKEGFDVGLTSLVETDRMGGGGKVFAQWLVSAGPRDGSRTRHWGIIGMEINTLEREKDQGLKLTRNGKFSACLQIVPENNLNVGDGARDQGYNGSFGLVFSPSGKPPDVPWPKARLHVPMCIEPGAIADDGIGIVIHGEKKEDDEPVQTPGSIMQFHSRFRNGVSFKGAEIENDEALQFRPEHKLKWGDAVSISGFGDPADGLLLKANHLYLKDETRSIYLEGDTLLYRWRENGEWKYQKMAGPG